MADYLLIRDGGRRSLVMAREGDGIKLIFPTGPESASRVRRGIAPTLMTADVVGVIVRRIE